MPTYGYRCEACEHEFEEYQSIKAEPIKVCPQCKKSKVRRLIGTGAAVLFKGSGFYGTDYRSKTYSDAAKADSSASTSSASSSSSSSGTSSSTNGSSSAPAASPSTSSTSGSTSSPSGSNGAGGSNGSNGSSK